MGGFPPIYDFIPKTQTPQQKRVVAYESVIALFYYIIIKLERSIGVCGCHGKQ
jgi:hypothetical protein